MSVVVVVHHELSHKLHKLGLSSDQLLHCIIVVVLLVIFIVVVVAVVSVRRHLRFSIYEI